MGKVAKTYLAQKRGIEPKMMRMISIMPGTAKKGEAAREQLASNGIPDVDIVLTMREFARLLRDMRAGRPRSEALRELAKTTGVAALIATHNMELAGHMDRVFALKDGHLEERPAQSQAY